MKKYTITQYREMYPNDDACLDKLFKVRYDNLVCPKCESDKVFTKVKNRRAYQCPVCSYQIYPTKGTVFEKSTTPLTYWFYAIFLQTTTRNGVAAKELERQLNICYKTALRMAHQIKILMSQIKLGLLSGILEGDETFIGGLSKNRHADKRIPNSQGRSTKDKTPVLGIMKRGGNIIAKVIADTSKESIQPVIRESVVKDASILITDEWWGYRGMDKDMPHVIINHNQGEYIRGAFHINTIEGFWAQLKRTIKGTHIHVSPKHLQKYVDEVAFRYMHRDKQDEMFETILSHVAA